MSIPYTYYLHWSSLQKSYYGVRYANTRPPEEDLWVEYFSSSKMVSALREEFGDPDVIQIRKTFDDAYSARIWEQRVLQKLNVIKSDRWLNRSIPGARDLDDIAIQKISDYFSGSRWINDGSRSRQIPKETPLPKGWVYGRLGMNDNWKQKLSEANKGNKHKEETINLYRRTRKGPKNSFYGKKHSKETLNQMSNSHNEYWKSISKVTYHTPWGNYWSTPKAANDAPFEVSSSMIWHWCIKYPEKIIDQKSKFGKYNPEAISKSYSEVGFGFSKI